MRSRAGASAAMVTAAGAALAAAGLVILGIGHGLTFLQDEWVFIQFRLGGGFDTYLEPANEHLVLVPVVLHKALFVTAGIEHFWPYLAVGIVAHLACLVLLYLVARPIVGRSLAVLVLLPLVFIGAAWEVVLIPLSEMQWCVSIAALLGLLLLLDRRDARSEIACSLLLILAFASSSLGVSIAAGVVVHVLWHPDRWRRIWIPALPIALYGLWFFTYNRDPDYAGPRQFPPSVRYMFDAAAGALGGLLGLPIGGETTGRTHRAMLATVYLITALSVLVAAWLVVVRRRVSARLAMLVVTMVSNWTLLAITRGLVADPWSSRYIYVGAFLIVLVALELARDVSIGPRVLRASAAVACAAGALNLVWLEHDARLLRDESARAAAQMGALEISRDFVKPSFYPDTWPRTRVIIAAPYFHATDRLGGSPAMSPSEIAASAEHVRASADGVMLRAAEAQLLPFIGPARPLIDVARQKAATSSTEAFSLGSGRPRADRVEAPLHAAGVILRSTRGVAAEIRVRRFATAFPRVAIATVGRTPQFLSVPRGRAAAPWHLQVAARGSYELLRDGNRDVIASSSGRVEVCEGTGACRRFVPLVRVAASTMPVVPHLVSGFVEELSLRDGRLELSGWAADKQLGAAERVVVFADARPVAVVTPSRFRRDVADHLAKRLRGGTRVAGFTIRRQLEAGAGLTSASNVRVFALIGERVSEIPVLPGSRDSR